MAGNVNGNQYEVGKLIPQQHQLFAEDSRSHFPGWQLSIDLQRLSFNRELIGWAANHH